MGLSMANRREPGRESEYVVILDDRGRWRSALSRSQAVSLVVLEVSPLRLTTPIQPAA